MSEIVPGVRHAKTGVNIGQMLRLDSEIMIAGQVHGAVAQSRVAGQDCIELGPAPVDKVAQGDDEGQVFAVENVDRRIELGKACAIVTAHLGPGRDVGILGIGDDAERKERF